MADVPSKATLETRAATDTPTPFSVGDGQKPSTYRVGNKVLDLYPIRVKDWPEASRHVTIMRYPSLSDVAMVGGIPLLKELVKIAARIPEKQPEEALSLLDEMTNNDYTWLRQVLTAQNDIDIDRVMKDIEKLSGKNAGAPPSR